MYIFQVPAQYLCIEIDEDTGKEIITLTPYPQDATVFPSFESASARPQVKDYRIVPFDLACGQELEILRTIHYATDS